jgi:hypothetical protein
VSVSRETAAFVMGAITGHALATARKAETEVKLVRARETLRWAAPYVDSTTWNDKGRDLVDLTLKKTAP